MENIHPSLFGFLFSFFFMFIFKQISKENRYEAIKSGKMGLLEYVLKDLPIIIFSAGLATVVFAIFHGIKPEVF